MVAFLAYHIYAMFSLRLSGHADFAAVQRLFTTGWVRALYITGVIAAAFTAGNGAATMLSQWGITASRRANDAASMAMWIVTLVLAAWGIRVVFLY
jgi:succinate dehydrogenase/fumarate reductase cytochrome b subunit